MEGLQSNGSGSPRLHTWRPQTRGRSSGTAVANTRGQSRGMMKNKIVNDDFPKEGTMQINELDAPLHQSSYQT